MFTVILGLSLFCSCGNSQPEEGDVFVSGDLSAMRTVTDFLGRNVTVPETVESVICVGVGALRYTIYLEALELVVGVEQNEIGIPCTKPFSYIHQDYLKTLPWTGNNGETYDEEIIAANPDVIVAYLDEASSNLLQEKTGIPVVTIPHLEGVMDGDVYFTLELLGELYGKQDRAAELLSYLHEIKADVDARKARVASSHIPDVYVGGVSFRGAHGFEGTEAGYGPLTALDANNIADSVGQNFAFDMDLEAVLAQNPEYIFLDLGNMNLIREQYKQNPGFYESFTAVAEGRVFSQISFRYNATNTELALANMYYMGTVLYPEAFGDIDPAEKTDEIFEMFLGVEDYYSVLQAAGFAFRPIDLSKE